LSPFLRALIGAGAAAAPAFTVTLTALSNASGSVTTQAFITGGGGGGSSDLATVMSQALAGNSITGTGGITTATTGIASRTTGVAPMGVFFDATATTNSLGVDNFHDILYLWNFGDTETAWTYGTGVGDNSKNRARGGVAAHVYETAGTYTAKVTPVTVSSGGSLSYGTTTSITITVAAADTTFSGTATVCVANGAAPVPGVNGVPTGATCVGGITTVSAAMTQAGINSGSGTATKRLLFKRGDTFDVPSADYVRKSSGIIGAFGSGANPVIRFTSNNPAFMTLTGVGDWSYMDLDFQGSGGFREKGVTTQFSAGSNILMLRLSASNTGGMEPSGDGVFMVDCNLHELVGGSGFVGFYSQLGSRVVALGNRIYDVSGIEHNIRFQGCTKIVISNNTLYKPADAKHLITLRGRSNQDSGHIETWSGVWCEKVVVSDNDMDVGATTGPSWAAHFGAQNQGAAEQTRDVIFERNCVRGNTTTLVCTEASERATIRNNLMVASFNGTYQAGVIDVRARSEVSTPPPASTYIYNNSIYQPSGVHAYFEAIILYLDPSANVSAPTGVVATNNLVYAPNATNNDYTLSDLPLFIGGSVGSSWTTTSNSTDSQIKSTVPGFTIPPTTTFTTWKPTSSYGINGGAYVPVFDDFFGAARIPTYDMGAVNP